MIHKIIPIHTVVLYVTKLPSQVRLVFVDMFVQFLPEGEHGRSVEMPLVPAQGDDGDGPVCDVLL